MTRMLSALISEKAVSYLESPTCCAREDTNVCEFNRFSVQDQCHCETGVRARCLYADIRDL